MVDNTTPQVKSATRTLDIIEFVVSRGRPVVAQDVATALSIPVSSLSYLLATLVDRGYLEREGRRYTAGPGLQRLQVRERSFSLKELVAPLTRTLRVQLNETSSFFVRRDWALEALVTETSGQALRYAVPPGTLAGMHSFAAGKALLAELGEEELNRYFNECDRPAFTETTITSEADLREEIARIRNTKVAITAGEHTPGIVGLGRAARLDGEIVGAFSVALPAIRFNQDVERRTREMLVRATALLESA